jgi:hypothetical protein
MSWGATKNCKEAICSAVRPSGIFGYFLLASFRDEIHELTSAFVTAVGIVEV